MGVVVFFFLLYDGNCVYIPVIMNRTSVSLYKVRLHWFVLFCLGK